MSRQLISDQQIMTQLEVVKENMKQEIKSGDAYLDGSLDYLMAAGGKMLRPLLLLIASKMGKISAKKVDDLIDLATAIETVHMATLIHDDVIDQANMRRGQSSIQAKYGQSYAVYMGDYLFSQSFLMLTHLDLKKDHATRLAKVVQRICVGDMKQHQKRYDVSITPLQYIKIVSGKTAALIATALSSGAYFVRAKEEHIKLLGRIGYEIGMTFQLVDDLLDYEGDPAVVGKELRHDILRGYYSMPVIFALGQNDASSEKLKSYLCQDLSAEDLNAVLQLVRESGGIDMTRDLAIRYNNRAISLIDSLPNGKTKDLLNELVPQLLDRVL